jgi:hypothetical protein
MSKKIRRRAALGTFVLTFTIVLNGAPAQPRAAFGGVRVDVASLRAEVGDPALVRTGLTPHNLPADCSNDRADECSTWTNSSRAAISIAK